jgi:hypothetical protein
MQTLVLMVLYLGFEQALSGSCYVSIKAEEVHIVEFSRLEKMRVNTTEMIR